MDTPAQNSVVVDNHDVEKALEKRDKLLDEELGEGWVGQCYQQDC